MSFNAKDYWNKRLDEQFSLKGVGYITFSQFYNKWLYKRKEKSLEKIFAKYMPDLQNKKVLDIGCGTGFFVERYVNKGAKISGIDITTKSINELSKRFPQGKFHLLDLGDSNSVLDEKFDVINMWDVMYHIVDNESFSQACKNIAAMSAPGAYFLVTDFLGAENERRPAPHVAFRDLKKYEDVLLAEGYRLVQIVPLYRFLNRHYRWGLRVTNFLAPILFFLDNHNNKVMTNNLSIGIWKFEK